MKITLVRHGQTEENFCNRVQGKKNNLLKYEKQDNFTVLYFNGGKVSFP